MARLTRPRVPPWRRQRHGDGVLPGSALDGRDLVREVLASLLARPGRAALTILGTVLGIGALVATLGIAQTAGGQIVSRFNELAATSVRVEPQSSFGSSPRSSTIPFDAEDRLVRLNGVRAAGTRSEVDVGESLVRSVPVNDPLGQTAFQIDVVATSPGLLDAVRGSVATGRYFDSGHSERADPVVVLGPGAAERLNVNRVSQQPAIYIGEELFVVIGILGDVAREPDLLNAVLLPDGTAAERYDLEAPGAVVVDTEVGAAQLIGGQAAVALDPNEPDRLQVTTPPDPTALRGEVQADVNALFLVLGGVSLLVGAIGIANVTLVSVLERVGEIGLRRALGAARRHVALQFLVESAAMGLAGGMVGASLGVLVIVAVSAVRVWTPVLDAWVPLGAPVLGGVVGLLAGVYPSLRAASLEPVDALRAGT